MPGDSLRVSYKATEQCGTTSARRGVQICPPPLLRVGVPQMNKLSPPPPTPWWEGAHCSAIKGSGRLSEPVVNQMTALHAVPSYKTSTYPGSVFPAHSTSFSK